VINGARAYGRGGLGAVWGAKNLKAVAVRDGSGLSTRNGERFKLQVEGLRKRLRENPQTRRGGPWNTFGTMMTLGVTQAAGTLPTLNWQENVFQGAAAIQADAFKPLITGTTACFGCPIACGRTARVRIDGVDTITAGPEYETLYAFGPNLGVADPAVLVRANHLCADYGLDTISTGVIIGFAMECAQKGLLPDGPAVCFGDGKAALAAIPAIAGGTSSWSQLANGVKKASASIPGSSPWAMHVKGLELPGYDPRGMKGQALCYAVADRGGCHLRSSTLGPELLGVPSGYDRLSYEGRAELIDAMQLTKIIYNTLPVCLFAGAEIHPEDGAEAVSAVLGLDLTVDDLLKTARRTRTLIRLFNVREGFARADDTLPDRLFDEPTTRGPSSGEIVDRGAFERMLTAYYDAVGWSIKTGIPKDESVACLGLKVDAGNRIPPCCGKLMEILD
jgi:aldehyde:ferredoxin oxidoreductase